MIVYFYLFDYLFKHIIFILKIIVEWKKNYDSLLIKIVYK